ncbi:uncharacterized protein LOC120276091 [Dioscorea cayenensis subsp. rotundata]|uniref:Uncharacterized protein LOC120276091 n=1 Tax=Dioscorea cayennensis subsp. rotundata TaxID=55577 RepID=A0AB40CFQ2_DIOCR|nr:uncharacterized protein LOC120276091 [Dioscorea cayenensis subsp. rotundata]
MRNKQASLQNLENQVGWITKLVSKWPQGSLLSNTEANPHVHLKAIPLRSGEKVGMGGDKMIKMEKEPEIKVIESLARKSEPTSIVEKRTPPLVKEYILCLLYPLRLLNDHTDKQFKRFLDLLKQLHISVPFVEALSQMPKYAKFLKDLLTNKRKSKEVSTVTLSEGSSALLQK